MCSSAAIIRLLAPLTNNFETTSFSTARTMPSLHRTPMATLKEIKKALQRDRMTWGENRRRREHMKGNQNAELVSLSEIGKGNSRAIPTTRSPAVSLPPIRFESCDHSPRVLSRLGRVLDLKYPSVRTVSRHGKIVSRTNRRHD